MVAVKSVALVAVWPSGDISGALVGERPSPVLMVSRKWSFSAYRGRMTENEIDLEAPWTDTHGYTVDDEDDDDPVLLDHNGRHVDTWRERYPYDERMPHAEYEHVKRRLQIELLKLQNWSKQTGARHVILFEGRDAAGKGGTIKRFMEHLNPRGARVVAVEKQTESEKSQWYFQRFVRHLPTAGEMVLFDRSWYNRAGVERVMGFCTPEQYLEFLRQAPMFEDMLVSKRLHITKFWFSVSPAEQRTRFAIRLVDPVRQWKFSPMDMESIEKWADYTAAKEDMFRVTDTTSPRGSWSRATTRSAPASTPCAICSPSSTTTRRTMSW